MLDSHSQLAIPPETGFIAALPERLERETTECRDNFLSLVTGFPREAPAWSDYGITSEEFRESLLKISPFTHREGVRQFYRLYAEKQGKLRFGDKTPMYAFYTKQISSLLPEAHFIHIIRDGRDTACSLRNLWFRPGDSMEILARHWMESVSAARERLKSSNRYHEVRFETLVTSPEKTLREICRFLSLRFESTMLDYHFRASERLAEHQARLTASGQVIVTKEMRRQIQSKTEQPPDAGKISVWKNELTIEEALEFESVAGELLLDLGYELSAVQNIRRKKYGS